MTTTNNELTIPQLSERFSLPVVDIYIIRDACCKGASIGQLGLFLYQCKRLNLDPMLKQAYWINGAFVIGIDGFRAKAEETGEFKGSLPAQWLNNEGEWLEEWVEDGPPVAARVAVMREGFEQPTIVTCKFSSYNKPNAESWKKMPEHMLAKCAEAGALRKAFPMVFGGVYSSDEITREGKVIEPEAETIDPETGEVIEPAKGADIPRDPKITSGIDTETIVRELARNFQECKSLKELQAYKRNMREKIPRDMTEEQRGRLNKAYDIRLRDFGAKSAATA